MSLPKGPLDALDARILSALNTDPRATVLALAAMTGLSRNTVQARISRLDQLGALEKFERRIKPAALGYPLAAFILAEVTQRLLTEIARHLAEVPEVVEVHGLSGVSDLLIHVVGRDADDLYRTAARILAIEGVEKTSTSLVMRKLVDYRLDPLVTRLAE